MPYPERPIRRLEDIVCEDSGRYQMWSLLQETPIRRIQSLGYARARIGMVIKDLDLKPKIDVMVRDFLDPSWWKELSKETSSKILPYGDGSCWKTFKPFVKRASVLHQPDGVRSQRHHIVPIEEINGVLIALVARVNIKSDDFRASVSETAKAIKTLGINKDSAADVLERIQASRPKLNTGNRLGRLEQNLTEVYGVERRFFLYFIFSESR
ncbi:hypothetical protein Tco_0494466 [Tanacetum coccineum]